MCISHLTNYACEHGKTTAFAKMTYYNQHCKCPLVVGEIKDDTTACPNTCAKTAPAEAAAQLPITPPMTPPPKPIDTGEGERVGVMVKVKCFKKDRKTMPCTLLCGALIAGQELELATALGGKGEELRN